MNQIIFMLPEGFTCPQTQHFLKEKKQSVCFVIKKKMIVSKKATHHTSHKGVWHMLRKLMNKLKFQEMLRRTHKAFIGYSQ